MILDLEAALAQGFHKPRDAQGRRPHAGAP
jgi:hypothetical protein